jgi:hypothetical protein
MKVECSFIDRDLSYIHNVIKNDFSGYHHDKALKNKADENYHLLKKGIPNCESRLDYVRTIKKYFSILDDPHIQPVWNYISLYKSPFEMSTGKSFDDARFDFVDYKATGIIIKKVADRFFVKNIDNNLIKKNVSVRVGDELISYNGKKPQKVLVDDIMSFEAVSVKKAGEYYHAEKLFFRWDITSKGPMEFVFKRGEQIIKEMLVWNKVSSDYLEKFVDKGSENIYKTLDKPYGKWVILKSLAGYTKEANSQLTAFIADALDLRSERNLVLDLRGNGGGVSTWGSQWIENLYGYRPSISTPPPLLLASRNNFKHYERFYTALKENNGINSKEAEQGWLTLLNCLRIQNGKLVECAETAANEKTINQETKPKKSLFSGQLIVLTDWKNFSSTELFIQELKEMPNVTLAGIETNASTPYGDIRFDITPGGLPFVVPTKVFRGIYYNRGNRKPFTPDIEINYDVEKEVLGEDSLMLKIDKLLESQAL